MNDLFEKTSEKIVLKYHIKVFTENLYPLF